MSEDWKARAEAAEFALRLWFAWMGCSCPGNCEAQHLAIEATGGLLGEEYEELYPEPACGNRGDHS